MKRSSLVLSLALFSLLLYSGCGGSSRSSVEGYEDAQLSGKRVFVLMPQEGEYALTSPANFAWSRGIGEAGADGRVSSEFRTNFASQLDARYDSNTVHNYATQSVGSTHPLSAEVDFRGEPSTWDWSRIDAARKAAAIDFLLVLTDVTIANSKSTNGGDRGREQVTARARLLDMATKGQLVDQVIEISVSDPRQPIDTYVLLARKLAQKLPFMNHSD